MKKRFDHKDWRDDLQSRMSQKKLNLQKAGFIPKDPEPPVRWIGMDYDGSVFKDNIIADDYSTGSITWVVDSDNRWWSANADNDYNGYWKQLADRYAKDMMDKHQQILSATLWSSGTIGTWDVDESALEKIHNRQCPKSEVSIPENIIPGDGRMVGYLEGYRAWRLDLKRGRLVSDVFDEVTWEPRKPIRANKVKVAVYGTKGAGIYAAKDKNTITGSYAEGSPFSSRKAEFYMIGKVALWGQIKEHKNGYRAEYAYPLEFLNIIGIAKELEFTLLRAISDIYLPRR